MGKHIHAWESQSMKFEILRELAERQGMGIIAKRPIANGVWGATTSDRRYTDEYVEWSWS